MQLTMPAILLGACQMSCSLRQPLFLGRRELCSATASLADNPSDQCQNRVARHGPEHHERRIQRRTLTGLHHHALQRRLGSLKFFAPQLR